MRRLGRLVSFVVALAYIGLTYRGTALLRRDLRRLDSGRHHLDANVRLKQ